MRAPFFLATVRSLVHRFRTDTMARNSAFIILNTLVTGTLGFAFWGLTTHTFTTQSVGTASALISAMTLGATAAMFGMGTTALQVLPSADDDLWSAAVNSIVIGGAALGVIAGAGVALLTRLTSTDLAAVESPGVLVLLVLGTGVLTVAMLLDYIFLAERSAHYILLRGTIFSLLKLAVIAAFVALSGRSTSLVIIAWVVASGVTSALSVTRHLTALRRSHRLRPAGVWTYIFSRKRILLLHHITALGGTLTPTIMPVLVVALVSATANAYFYMAWLLASVLLTVSNAVAGSLLTEISYDLSGVGQQVKRAARLIGAMLVPSILGVLAFGHLALRIFGRDYAAHSYWLLVLFALVAIPDAATNVYVAVLRGLNRAGVAAALNVGMALIALMGAWWMLPHLGTAGAAWAWAASQTAGAGFSAVHARTRLSRSPGVAPLPAP